MQGDATPAEGRIYLTAAISATTRGFRPRISDQANELLIIQPVFMFWGGESCVSVAILEQLANDSAASQGSIAWAKMTLM